jgi:hypothetical protein
VRAVLDAAVGPAESVSPVEVARSAELVIALVGLVFSGVGAAKTIWDRRQERRSEDVRVRIFLDDGTSLELSGVDERQLHVEFQRRTQPGT